MNGNAYALVGEVVGVLIGFAVIMAVYAVKVQRIHRAAGRRTSFVSALRVLVRS